MYTSEEVAKALGVTPKRVPQLVKELNLTPRRIGRMFLFTAEELKAMRNRNKKLGRPKVNK